MKALELYDALRTYLGNTFPLSTSVAFDYPCLGELKTYIQALVTGSPSTITFQSKVTQVHEPIAVIGMSCRFPGGEDITAFWDLLAAGKDTVQPIPENRAWLRTYLSAPGYGGFIENIEYFDAAFFKITPREAEQMDPQQRMLLEVSWEALEDAGIKPTSLLGSDTGVFIGAMASEFKELLLRSGNDVADAYFATGNDTSVLAGRIAYTLGLQGPTLTINTACSSSLVALHEACQNLRHGECKLAIAGGVNALLSADEYEALTKAQMLAHDGYCKTFDANADGYVRGEGCGLIVLKRLSDAKQDGDRILAIIRGSAVNQDGASSGLTVPNGIAQERLLQRALANADLQPSDIDFIETHGTGTSLGDPMEVNALNRVFAGSRKDQKYLYLGALKTNIGHLEAAAGIASVIKTILALQHETIPKNLHFSALNPQIDLTPIPAQLPLQPIAWKKTGKTRYAGISSFGFSGTNAHVILEEAPQQDLTQIKPALPKTIFNRKWYWIEAIAREQYYHVKPSVHLHPLLGERIALTAAGASLYLSHINRHYPSFIEDHQLFSTPILSAPAYISSLLSAAFFETGKISGTLAELEYHQPLALMDDKWHILKTYLERENMGSRKVTLSSELREIQGSEQLHVTCKLSIQTIEPDFPILESIATLQSSLARHIDAEALYNHIAPFKGFTFTRHSKWIEELWCDEKTSLARLRLAEADELASDGFLLHPGCIESCLYALLAIHADDPSMYVPFAVSRIIYAIDEQPLWAFIRLKEPMEDKSLLYLDLYLMSANEKVIFYAEDMALKFATRETLQQSIEQKLDFFLTSPLELPTSSTSLERISTLKDVEDRVKSALSRILGIASEDIPPNQGLTDLGMDSMMAVEIAQILRQQFGEKCILNATVIYENPSLTKLVEYLAEKSLGVARKKVQPRLSPLHVHDNEAIAIIGMSCRFPGGANSLEEFWQLLAEGRDGISVVPATRWNIDEYYDPDVDKPGKINTRMGGFLNIDISEFDAAFFKISPREAEKMDPQLRILLELSCEALSHAGIAPEDLQESHTAVFVGVWARDYGQLLTHYSQAEEIDAYTTISLGEIAGRISYTLGLQGPSFIIDTACSSSLVALHEACQSLRRGESDMALVGGSNLLLDPLVSVHFSKAHMLASDGYCKTFDKAADGYVRSEGAGMVVVKTLSAALRDRDPILAVIRETGINQDGASGGFTVPNGKAQEQLLRQVLAQADIPANTIDYFEAHGTGTNLGDPIEFNAIKAVYSEDRLPEQLLILASVKTNLGHLESAAGMASLIKMVLALQHKQIPAHLHLHQVNPLIDLSAIPATIPNTLLDWPRHDYPKRGAISSFGATGTNAHMIIEEAPEQDVDQLRPSLPEPIFNRQRYWAKYLEREQVHYQLQLPATGLLSDLRVVPYTPPSLNANEVLIKVT
ncbi:MAG: beta-ketoacyl synthase N-terminal-like domain-containing protein, partial [Legionellales bacterium]